MAQECVRAGAGEIDDRHVRHVEHAGGAAHRVVLFDLRTVVQRHFPTAEIDHPRAGRDVGGIEMSAGERHAAHPQMESTRILAVDDTFDRLPSHLVSANRR